VAYIRERQADTHRLSRGSIQTLSRESLCVSEYAEFLPRCKWIYTVYSDTHRLSRGSIEILVRERVCVSEYTDSLARCKWIYSVSSVTHRLSRRVCESVYMRHGIYVCHVIQTHAHTHTHIHTHTHTHTHTQTHTCTSYRHTELASGVHLQRHTDTHTHTDTNTDVAYIHMHTSSDEGHFHSKCYTREIHQIEKLRFLGISRYKFRLGFWFNLKLRREM